MPIYTKKGRCILHVHIPKTGGSSITEMFKEAGWGVDKWSKDGIGGQHAIRDRWKKWGNFSLVFTIVRHPVFRALSDARSRVQKSEKVDHWIQNWCKEGYNIHGDHNRPQTDFFRRGDGTLLYYNSPDTFPKITEISGYNGGIPHIRGDRHKNHSPSFLSAHTLEIVQSTFNEDMKEFGFHWLGKEDL